MVDSVGVGVGWGWVGANGVSIARTGGGGRWKRRREDTGRVLTALMPLSIYVAIFTTYPHPSRPPPSLLSPLLS